MVYSFSKARLQVSRFIEAKSEAIPHSVRSRRVKNTDGEEFTQHYAVRGKCMPDGAEKTIWAILRMAIKQLEKLRRVPELELEDACVSQLPPVATNCKELCQALVRGSRVSDRTVRSHIDAGLKLGIFTKKKFRGTRANFYVWVNPDFLVENMVEKPPVAAPDELQNCTFEGRTGTNFPLNKLLVKYSKEIETDNVDKLLSRPEGDGVRLFNKREEESEAEKSKAARGAALVPPAGPEMSFSPGGAPKRPLIAPKPAISSRQIEFVKEFTFTAWRELYTPRGVTFTDEQSRDFLNAVWAGVYGKFKENWSEATQLRYHEQALERLGMAAAYFARNPHKYAPMPYAEFVPGTGYFDAENQRGFIKTLDWHERQAANRLRRKIAEGLKSARRQWRQHLQGKAPKKVQQRSLLELYRYHESKFKQLGTQALQSFYRNFQHPASSLAKVPVA